MHAPFLHPEQAPGLCAQCNPGRLPSGVPAPVYAHTARTDAPDLPPCSTSKLVDTVNIVLRVYIAQDCSASLVHFCVGLVFWVICTTGDVLAFLAPTPLTTLPHPTQPPPMTGELPPMTTNSTSRVTKPDTSCVCKACRGARQGVEGGYKGQGLPCSVYDSIMFDAA